MFRPWRLGTAFGIGIFVHWTFALLPVWAVVTNWGDVPRLLEVLGLIVALFGFVVLHELGHALAARRFGIDTRDITLYPIGGVARLERMSERPWEELCIALAGPAVNAGLALLLLTLSGGLFLGLNLSGHLLTVGSDAEAGFGAVRFLLWLAGANVILGLFNLVPAFPMDGGRVLRALLAMWLPRLQATAVAANLGAVIAVLLALLGFFAQNPMLFLVAAFVFFAGRQELAVLRHREMMKNLPPQPAEPDVVTVEPVAPTAVPEHFSGVLWDRHTGAWVVWQDGRPVGTVGGGPRE